MPFSAKLYAMFALCNHLCRLDKEIKDDFSEADVKAICTEAGLLSLRESRMELAMLWMFQISIL